MTSISVYVQLQTKTEYMHKSHKVKIRETADRTDEWREREREDTVWVACKTCYKQTNAWSGKRAGRRKEVTAQQIKQERLDRDTTVQVTKSEREREKHRKRGRGRGEVKEEEEESTSWTASWWIMNQTEHPDGGRERECDGEYRGLHYSLNHWSLPIHALSFFFQCFSFFFTSDNSGTVTQACLCSHPTPFLWHTRFTFCPLSTHFLSFSTAVVLIQRFWSRT